MWVRTGPAAPLPGALVGVRGLRSLRAVPGKNSVSGLLENPIPVAESQSKGRVLISLSALPELSTLLHSKSSHPVQV